MWWILLLFTLLPSWAEGTTNSPDRFLVVLDPGHGGTAETDQYRVGPSGEREEWINLRVALELKFLLEQHGIDVLLTREEDVVVPLRDRAELAKEYEADLFLSIHHNATADPNVNFPIVYFHGSARENPESVMFGRHVLCEIRRSMFDDQTPMSLVSDRTIFPTSGTAVLRHSLGIPGIIAEASFFTHPEEEERLKQPGYNRVEAEAFLRAILAYRDQWAMGERVAAETEVGEIPPFRVFQEAERMRPEAREWREQFEKGKQAFESEEWKEALEWLTLSARAFPDSPVAGEAHRLRAGALQQIGKTEEARLERRRAEEYYVDSSTLCVEPFRAGNGIE